MVVLDEVHHRAENVNAEISTAAWCSFFTPQKTVHFPSFSPRLAGKRKKIRHILYRHVKSISYWFSYFLGWAIDHWNQKSSKHLIPRMSPQGFQLWPPPRCKQKTSLGAVAVAADARGSKAGDEVRGCFGKSVWRQAYHQDRKGMNWYLIIGDQLW